MAKDPEWIIEHESEELDVPIEDAEGALDQAFHRQPIFKIDSYGADYPVDALVKRMLSGDIFVPPFQRGFVWNKGQASRFVESLLLGLPVPGIFLAKTTADGRLLVVDGQQRLESLRAFCSGQWPDEESKPFQLIGVSPQFLGKTYQTLSPLEKRTLDDSLIHAIILKSAEDASEGIYFIFERINTGGTRLNGQEIRECIELGDMISLVAELNGEAAWRKLFGKKHRRGRDRELVLRFLAMSERRDQFAKPLRAFLDKYAHDHRKMAEKHRQDVSALFIETVGVILKAGGQHAFKPTEKRIFNAPAFEGIAVVVAGLIKKHGAQAISTERLSKAIEALYKDPQFSESIFDRTTNAYNVSARFEAAEAILAGSLNGSA